MQEKIKQLEKEISLLKRCVLYLSNDLENTLSEMQDDEYFYEEIGELIKCFHHFQVMMFKTE